MRISKEDPILIIGGGLTGLMTAVTLYHHEFTQVKIFEQQGNGEGEKVPVFLTSAAQEALESINMLIEIVVDSPALPRLEWLWKGSKSLRKIDFEPLRLKKGHGMQVHAKSALIAALKQRIPQDWITSGQEFISFTQNDKKVEAHFSGNTSASGALLIGADGRNSRVRLQMRGGTEARSTELLSYRAILDRNVLSNSQHLWLTSPCVEVMQAGMSASIVPIGARQAGLFLSLRPPAEMPPTPQAIKTWLQEMYTGWPDPIPSAIEQTWPADFVQEVHADIPITKGWTQNRVVLVGDAVHPSHAFLGFNESYSLASAGALGTQIATQLKRVERGLQRYEKDRYKPAKKFQKAARMHTKFIGNKGAVSTMLRNALLGSLPIGLTEKRLTRVLAG